MTDAAGNVAIGDVTVTVVDTTAPEIRLTGGPAEGATCDASGVPDAPACAATDTVGGTVGCDIRGYDDSVGDHILTATATDAAGNRATVRLAYAVATPPAPTATVGTTVAPAPTVGPAIVPTGIPTEKPARSNAPPVIPDGTPVGAAR